MANQILKEQTMSFANAATILPPCRGGKPPHPSTIFRWASRGVIGPGGARIRLEAVRLGATWITSAEAIERFCAALTPSNDTAIVTPSTPSQRQRASERAAMELEAMGV
jgi:Protein of unknown function (DUF1580)